MNVRDLRGREANQDVAPDWGLNDRRRRQSRATEVYRRGEQTTSTAAAIRVGEEEKE